MADIEDLSQTVEAPLRESVQDDVRAAFEHHNELADKLVNDAPVNETVEQKAERQRNERGQFVAKEHAEAPQTAAQPKEITDADRREEQVAQPSTAGGPPTSWSADAKAAWSTLPPAIQAAAVKREAEINEGARQWSEQRRNYEQAFQPIQQLSQQYQMPPADVVSRLVAVEQRLGDARQAPQVIAELASAYGVDLTALVNGSPQPQTSPAAQFDPDKLFQTLDQRLEQRMTEREERQRQETALQQTIDGFGSAPGHEHFATVKVYMGHLLGSGLASDMQDAYDQAVYANPETRAKLMAQTIQPTVKARPDPRRAAVSLNGSPRGAAPVNRDQSKGSVLDDVRAAFEQHGGF